MLWPKQKSNDKVPFMSTKGWKRSFCISCDVYREAHQKDTHACTNSVSLKRATPRSRWTEGQVNKQKRPDCSVPKHPATFLRSSPTFSTDPLRDRNYRTSMLWSWPYLSLERKLIPGGDDNSLSLKSLILAEPTTNSIDPLGGQCDSLGWGGREWVEGGKEGSEMRTEMSWKPLFISVISPIFTRGTEAQRLLTNSATKNRLPLISAQVIDMRLINSLLFH